MSGGQQVTVPHGLARTVVVGGTEGTFLVSLEVGPRHRGNDGHVYTTRASRRAEI